MDALPKQFYRDHRFAFFLHDEIVHLLKHAESAEAFNIHFDLKNMDDAEGIAHNNTVEFLHTHGEYEEVADAVFRMSATPALIADFCNFIYETLSCSKRGKLTNAYYQLRRPLKDNLFVLEWLLADAPDMIRRLRNHNPIEYAVEKIAPERKLAIIAGAAIKSSGDQLNPKLLYKLRYEKNYPFGFEHLFQKSVHLVTSHAAYATERQNFNFIFSDPDSRLTQWYHLYKWLPYVLFHALNVIEKLLAEYGIVRADNAIIETYLQFVKWHGKGCDQKLESILALTRNEIKHEGFDTSQLNELSGFATKGRIAKVPRNQLLRTWQQIPLKTAMRICRVRNSVRFLYAASEEKYRKSLARGQEKIMEVTNH